MARPTCLLFASTLALIAACGGSEPAAQDESASPGAAVEETSSANAGDAEASPTEAEPAETHAESHDAGASERLGTHEHGAGSLAVTVQGKTLTVSFETPLASLGLPEDPQNDEDRAAIEAVQNAFSEDTAIVSLDGNVGCNAFSRSSSSHISNGHGELQVEYNYECSSPDALKSVRFAAFETYPGLAENEAV